MPCLSRGYTLVECLVVLAILATLAGLLAPLTFKTKDRASPPAAGLMWTVQHDGHWWILCRENFAHHPDCPCKGKAERE